MATFSLSNLRSRAQQMSDNVNSGFVASTGTPPVEWTQLVNDAYTELFGTLVTSFESYYVKNPPYSFTTNGVDKLFALPSDFFKLIGIDLLIQGTNVPVTLKPFTFPERNQYNLASLPVPMSGQTLQLWYVPALTPLANDNDVTVDIPNGWDELIPLSAAIVALDKEESDVSVKMARKQMLLARIEAEAANRDAGSPARIVDFYAAQSPGMRYHIVGSNLWLVGGNTPPPAYGDGYFEPWGMY